LDYSVFGAKLFCDTYNANPISMGVALEFLRKKSTKYPAGVEGKTWAVLGDMLELGTQEKELHSALAEQILSLNIDQILLYGPRMAALADSLKKSGHSATQHFTDQNEIIHLLKQKTQSGDSVLLKGSRGMRMENIWKALTSIG
jgi:UDP-N-acetylmuramoyl-tripeptide--D-alanyl-D-alanine ligase